MKLKQERLTMLYRLLGAYEKQLNDEAQGLGARTVAMVANWVYDDMEESDPKGASNTWFVEQEE